MGRRIVISAGSVRAEAELNDSSCAQAIYQALPITARASTWGQEIYFAIPVECSEAADAREKMVVGELAYWPPGNAFCIFFGPTPASGRDGVPRAASPVNPVGKLLGDAGALRQVRDGEKITIDLPG